MSEQPFWHVSSTALATSAELGELAPALAKAQSAIKGAVKDSANPFFKSTYADLDSVWGACREPLTTNGLAVVQSPRAEGPVVYVDTMLLHSSGQWIRGSLSVRAKDESPQAVGSCITYLRRYALQSFVGVAPEDDDGEAAMERGPEPEHVTQLRESLKQTPRRQSAPAESEPESDGIGPRVKYTKIAKEGVNDKGNWTLYAVGLTDGREGTTFSKSIYSAAKDLMEHGRVVTAKFQGKSLLAIAPQEIADSRDEAPF